MCRLLCVHSARPFEIAPHLAAFASLSRDSREYQGHGWGLRVARGRRLAPAP